MNFGFRMQKPLSLTLGPVSLSASTAPQCLRSDRRTASVLRLHGVSTLPPGPPESQVRAPCRPSCSYSTLLSLCLLHSKWCWYFIFCKFPFQVKAVDREENMTESKQGNDPKVCKDMAASFSVVGQGRVPRQAAGSMDGTRPSAQHGPGLSLKPQAPGSMGGRPSESSLEARLT